MRVCVGKEVSQSVYDKLFGGKSFSLLTCMNRVVFLILSVQHIVDVCMNFVL